MNILSLRTTDTGHIPWIELRPSTLALTFNTYLASWWLVLWVECMITAFIIVYYIMRLFSFSSPLPCYESLWFNLAFWIFSHSLNILRIVEFFVVVRATVINYCCWIYTFTFSVSLFLSLLLKYWRVVLELNRLYSKVSDEETSWH